MTQNSYRNLKNKYICTTIFNNIVLIMINSLLINVFYFAITVNDTIEVLLAMLWVSQENG